MAKNGQFKVSDQVANGLIIYQELCHNFTEILKSLIIQALTFTFQSLSVYRSPWYMNASRTCFFLQPQWHFQEQTELKIASLVE